MPASALIINETDTEKHKVHLRNLFKDVEQLNPATRSSFPFKSICSIKNHEMNIGVNYTSMSFLGVPYTHLDGPALKILSSLLTSHYLHRELREKGGAYGGGAKYLPLEGLFQFMTYRDPPGYQRTFKKFEEAILFSKHISNHVISEVLRI